jgi:hypothetical protein
MYNSPWKFARKWKANKCIFQAWTILFYSCLHGYDTMCHADGYQFVNRPDIAKHGPPAWRNSGGAEQKLLRQDNASTTQRQKLHCHETKHHTLKLVISVSRSRSKLSVWVRNPDATVFNSSGVHSSLDSILRKSSRSAWFIMLRQLITANLNKGYSKVHTDQYLIHFAFRSVWNKGMLYSHCFSNFASVCVIRIVQVNYGGFKYNKTWFMLTTLIYWAKTCTTYWKKNYTRWLRFVLK